MIINKNRITKAILTGLFILGIAVTTESFAQYNANPKLYSKHYDNNSNYEHHEYHGQNNHWRNHSRDVYPRYEYHAPWRHPYRSGWWCNMDGCWFWRR